MPTTTAYRPRSATEIVDAAIQIVRRNFVPMITVVAVAYVPFLVLQMTVFRGLLVVAMSGRLVDLSTGMTLAYYTVSLIWFALIDAAMTVAASDAYLGRPVDVLAAFRRAGPRLGATMIGIGLKYLLILIGLLAFFVGSLYPLALTFATTATIVLEGMGPIAGVRRSGALSRNLKGHILVALIMVYGLYFGVIGGAGVAFTLLGNQTAIQLFSAVATILIYPFVPTVQMLLYYDARIRKEGFDIELLAQRVGPVAVPQPAY